MSRIPLTLVLATGLALPLAAQADNTFSFTAQNGTVVEGGYTCAQTDGVWTCELTSQWTAATTGDVATRDRTVTFQPGQPTQITLTGTRFNGNSIDHTRLRSHSRRH